MSTTTEATPKTQAITSGIACATADRDGIRLLFAVSGHTACYAYKRRRFRKTANQNPQVRNVDMNPIQSNMYRRAMYGLDAYSYDQIRCMPEEIKHQIIQDFRKANDALERLKYDRTYGAIDKLFNAMYPLMNSHYTQDMDISYERDAHRTRLPSLRELGIQTRDIVDLFIAEGLLPKNFYQINTDTLNL